MGGVVESTNRLLRSIPPQDLESEAVVLGAMLGMADAVDECRAILGAEMFYSPAHRNVFEAVCSVSDSGGRVDLLSVRAEMERAGTLDHSGGVVFLAELPVGMAGAGEAKTAAKLVRECHARRSMSERAAAIIDGAYDMTSDPDAVAALANEIIESGVSGAIGSGGSVGFASAADEFVGWCESRRSDHGGETLVPTPWEGINRLIGGLHGHEVTVLAGRPSNGKTAAALNVAHYVAKKGHTVGIVSLEMHRKQLLARMCAGDVGIDGRVFRQRALSNDEMGKVYDWCGRNRNLPMHICDRSSARPSELRAMIRRWRNRFGVQLVVVDYLQLVKPQDPRANREVQVADVSRTMKEIALETGAHVLLLCQMNREVEKRGKGAKPRLSDLRESGAVEQDADNVIFISPWDPATMADSVRVQFHVAKARNDCAGSANLIYMRSRLKFGDENYVRKEA